MEGGWGRGGGGEVGLHRDVRLSGNSQQCCAFDYDDAHQFLNQNTVGNTAKTTS